MRLSASDLPCHQALDCTRDLVASTAGQCRVLQCLQNRKKETWSRKEAEKEEKDLEKEEEKASHILLSGCTRRAYCIISFPQKVFPSPEPPPQWSNQRIVVVSLTSIDGAHVSHMYKITE